MNKSSTTNEYAIPFAAWELRLYLDTHPDDERALAAYRQLCASQGDNCSYACHTADARGGTNGCGGTQGTGTGRTRSEQGCGCMNSGARGGTCQFGQNDMHGSGTGGRVWHWIDDPWPWELAANLKGGDC